jgi:hypothetical protein
MIHAGGQQQVTLNVAEQALQPVQHQAALCSADPALQLQPALACQLPAIRVINVAPDPCRMKQL